MKTCDLFKAMGDETRLRILVVLSEEELCVSALEKILNLNQSNVSRHLAKLLGAELVMSRRSAQHIHYRLHSDLSSVRPDLYRLLLNLKIHPEFEADLAALELYHESSRTPEAVEGRETAFFEDDLI